MVLRPENGILMVDCTLGGLAESVKWQRFAPRDSAACSRGSRSISPIDQRITVPHSFVSIIS
jgi:hypothetical protein